MNHPVASSLIPVVLLIAIGFFAGRRGWVGGRSVKDLSNLVFFVLLPALMFRSMNAVRLEELDFRPIALYFGAALLLFGAVLWQQGGGRRAAVVALAAIFSNTIMIGMPLIQLAYGEAGFVLLITLISLHALVLLTLATVALELAVAREPGADGQRRSMGRTVLLAMRNSLIHPVPLPILAGLLFAHSGLELPVAVDRPLELLGNAFGPLALVMVGVTLSHTPIGENFKPALLLSLVKNLVMPALVATLGWAIGLRGLPLVVMVVTAALPAGANVFLFSQRYQVAEGLVTAMVAVSTLLALATLTVVMLLVGLV